MTPVLTAPPPETTTPPPAEKPRRRSVVIENVDWDTYEKLLAAFDGRRNARFAYDNGALEIMAPISLGHEDAGNFLGWLMPDLAGEYGLPIRGGGSVTMSRKELLKGIEPDNCYWLANAPRLAGVTKLDLTVHPPPDLAIEVDVTSDSLDKLAIYAGLGVPEVWRLDGNDLHFLRLGPDRAYAEVSASPVFPGLTPADLMTFLTQARAAPDQWVITQAFRSWVAGRAGKSGSPPAAI